MVTIQIEKEDLKLNRKKFSSFEDLLQEVEDYKFGKIMEKNDKNSFDINLLEKKYLG